MRHLMISFFALALAGFTFGCGGSSEEAGTTVVVQPTEGAELKPAPAPVFQESEFDDEIEIEADDQEIEVDRDYDDYEIEIDD